MKKRIILCLCMIALLSLTVGCTSSNGSKIIQAIIKSTNWQNFECTQEASVNIKLENVDLDNYYGESYNAIIDIINETNYKLESKVDLANTKASAKYIYNCNDVSIAGTSYYDKEKIWAKSPLKSKYVEIDLGQFFPNATDKFQTGTQERVKNLTLKLIKDYAGQYKYTLKNIQNKGTSVSGTKNITNYEIAVNNTEFYKMLKYTLRNIGDSEDVENYLADTFSTYVQSIDPEKLTDFVPDDVEREFIDGWEDCRKELKTNTNEIAKEFVKSIHLGSKGIVINVGIDEQGNLYSVKVTLNLIVSPDSSEERANITVNYNILFNNINTTTVQIPTFNGSNSITLREFVKSSESLKDSEIGDLLGVRPKYMTFYINENEFYANNKSYRFDVAPYIENDTVMIPGMDLGTGLGYKTNWDYNLETITYTDAENNKELKVTVNSNVAYSNGKRVHMQKAPVMVDGIVMVPARFVAEKLGGEIKWYGSSYSDYQYVRITREIK